jgi:hypothetical protein
MTGLRPFDRNPAVGSAATVAGPAPGGTGGFCAYDLRMGLGITSILWLMLTDVSEILTATLGVRSLFDRELRLDSKALRNTVPSLFFWRQF